MAASMVSSSPPTSVQASPVTMPISSLSSAVASVGRAEILRGVVGGGFRRLRRRQGQFFDRLADQGRELALEVAYARLARVAADDGQKRLVVDRPFLGIEAVLGGRMRNEGLACDLDLLVLGIACDTDDLHAVPQPQCDV